MSNQGTSGHPTIEAALGLRARAGSREALLRAAFDLVDTHPRMRVRQRSLVWVSPDPAHEQQVEHVAAIRVDAEFDIAGLEAAVVALQDRVCPPALGVDALRVELLWAHDPQGTPRVPAVPAVGPGEPDRPPLPPGEIYMHPDVPYRASACMPLSQAADHARDPVTTRFVVEFLKTVPEPYVERPRPFMPGFTSQRRSIDGGRVESLVTAERADLLAAAAEAYAGAPVAAQPIGPTTLLPDEAADVSVSVVLPPDVSLGERLLRWLHAVEQVIVGDALVVRRAAVIEDGPLSIRGVLFGARRDVAPSLGRPHDATVTIDPVTGACRAELTVLGP
jgi:hypothetical protein